MGSKEEQLQLMELLERYERALGYLYRVFAVKFPEHAAFWLQIENEEATHAFMVRSFRTMVEEDQLQYEPREFKKEAIHAALNDLEEALLKARKHGITIHEAFDVAIKAENGMLERKIFTPHDGDQSELKRMLRALEEDTTRHHSQIMEYYRKIGR